jgi:hypothetical protein
MDPSRDGGGGLTATGLLCGSCGTELSPNSKFCNECGTPLTQATRPAEYKQVTVVFADVVHSMDIAAAVGSERLREIMAQLVGRAKEVVQRYDGTVDKFTGDGIMAVFGAPVALEDHAVRACVAALGVQDEAKQIAVTVREQGLDAAPESVSSRWPLVNAQRARIRWSIVPSRAMAKKDQTAGVPFRRTRILMRTLALRAMRVKRAIRFHRIRPKAQLSDEIWRDAVSALWKCPSPIGGTAVVAVRSGIGCALRGR